MMIRFAILVALPLLGDAVSLADRLKCVGDSALCSIDRDSVRTFILGDTGGMALDATNEIGVAYATKAQERLAATMIQYAKAIPPDFIINVGDNIYFNGVRSVADRRFATLFETPYEDPQLDKPWYMIAGNHDHLGNVDAQVDYTKRLENGRWTFPHLWYRTAYSFAGNTKTVEFLFIDTIVMCGNVIDVDSRSIFNWAWSAVANRRTLDGPDPENVELDKQQMEWIKQRLEQSQADYVFVVGHYPIYSVSSHGPTKCLIEKLDPLLRLYNVSAYIAGHDHTLQVLQKSTESNGIMHYVISGAGSRIDPSEAHLHQTSDILMYRYPRRADIPWYERWSRAYYLGRGHGGFVRMDVGVDSAIMHFHAGADGNEAFKLELPPRPPKRGGQR